MNSLLKDFSNSYIVIHQVFKEWVNSLDCVRLGSEAPVATFERLLFVSPWYDLGFSLQKLFSFYSVYI